MQRLLSTHPRTGEKAVRSRAIQEIASLFAVIGIFSAFTLAQATIRTETSMSSSPDSPKSILERYCELDAEGKQLSADGWDEMASFFASPSPPDLKLIIVTKDFVVSDALIQGNRAKLYVEYVYLGEIYPRLGYTDPHIADSPVTIRGPIKVRIQYMLARSGQGSTWRIDGSHFAPHITLDSAIRYVTWLMNKTTDATVKRNAERTIVALARQR